MAFSRSDKSILVYQILILLFYFKYITFVGILKQDVLLSVLIHSIIYKFLCTPKYFVIHQKRLVNQSGEPNFNHFKVTNW